MCPRPATSREHVPPRCLFPARKDVADEVNYRKNLITVPSCDEHNSEKSHDDEYLMFALAGSYTSSAVGLAQFTTKVKRAFDQQPSKRLNFIRRSTPVRLRRTAGTEWEEGAQVVIEGPRIDNLLANCARALYFNQSGRKFLGPTEVMTNFTLYHDAEIQRGVTTEFEAAEQHLASRAAAGDNPAIFSYKFDESELTALFLFAFYENSTALVRFKKLLVSK
jgi:hypothetical protein